MVKCPIRELGMQYSVFCLSFGAPVRREQPTIRCLHSQTRLLPEKWLGIDDLPQPTACHARGWRITDHRKRTYRLQSTSDAGLLALARCRCRLLEHRHRTE